MREIRLHGSEGGGTEFNPSFLPLSGAPKAAAGPPPRRVAESGQVSDLLIYGILIWNRFGSFSARCDRIHQP